MKFTSHLSLFAFPLHWYNVFVIFVKNVFSKECMSFDYFIFPSCFCYFCFFSVKNFCKQYLLLYFSKIVTDICKQISYRSILDISGEYFPLMLFFILFKVIVIFKFSRLYQSSCLWEQSNDFIARRLLSAHWKTT